jgi:hypothetical protein
MHGNPVHRVLRFPLLLGATAAIACLATCGSHVTRLDTLVSPDGALIADRYQISGRSATSGSVGFVQIRPSSESFTLRSDFIFKSAPGRLVRVAWKNNAELEVTYSPLETDSLLETRWKAVSIGYRVDREMK